MSTYEMPKIRVGDAIYPALLTTEEAAAWLGLDVYSMRTKARLMVEGVAVEDMPIKAVRVGRLWKWPTLRVAEVAGLPAELVTEEAERTPTGRPPSRRQAAA